MPLDQGDLKGIKEIVVEAVSPYFVAIQKDFERIDDRFDKMDEHFNTIERLLIEDHRRRIQNLEEEVKELKTLLLVH